jgi:hypothetical protein
LISPCPYTQSPCAAGLQVLKIVLDLERLERLLEYDSEKSQLPAPSMGVPLVPLTARTSERHAHALHAVTA